MLIKQLSAFIENKPGRLAEVTKYLADAGINIHAISIADTTDFGILRLIVSDPELAKITLRSQGLIVKTTDVIAVSLDHNPGSLAKVLAQLATENIQIEYMYAFTSRTPGHDAMVILRLSNQDESIEKLSNYPEIRIIKSDLISEMSKAD